jgi:hypothetical protein
VTFDSESFRESMSSTRAFPLYLVFFDSDFVIFPFSVIAAPVVEASV